MRQLQLTAQSAVSVPSFSSMSVILRGVMDFLVKCRKQLDKQIRERDSARGGRATQNPSNSTMTSLEG